MNDYLQLAIAAMIVLLVLFAFWRHGRGNPENTGQLGRRLAKVEHRLTDCATRGALDLLAEQVRNLESHAASSGEVLAIEGKINELNGRFSSEISSIKETARDTRDGVRRIEAILMSGRFDK